MGQTLQITDEIGAYALTDRGTWLAYKGRLQARVLVQGDQRLHNPYAIIAVNPARFTDSAYEEAMQLIAWMTSPAGQAIIREFRVGDEVLFRPLAITE
jgi:tungstate transport system substrate-binding protein